MDNEHLIRRDTGDFHRACYDGVIREGFGVSKATADAACAICKGRIAEAAVVTQMLGHTAHLHCCFERPDFGQINEAS